MPGLTGIFKEKVSISAPVLPNVSERSNELATRMKRMAICFLVFIIFGC